MQKEDFYMNKNFEDKFMDIQSGLIALCMEITEGKDVDKIFAYVSMESGSDMFDAFVEIDGEILWLYELGIDDELMNIFFRTGLSDLERIEDLCEENDVETPTGIKMYYDVKSGKFDADYAYDEKYSNSDVLMAEDMLEEWYDEIKSQKTKQILLCQKFCRGTEKCLK